ncbi:MAG: hypothetical protein M3167_03535 [Acidobacteriota bacterium]|nr:hypothetical protein [Acidobacteriota bacterium]
MSRWTRILTLSLLPVAAVALGTAPPQEAAPATQVDSPARTTHKKKSNPSAEHGATTKSTAGADASLNPQPIPPGHTKSARRKSATTTTDGSNGELRDTNTKSARRKSSDGRRPNGELRDPSSKKTSKTSKTSKLNTDGEIRHPSSKKSSATSSKETGNDKGIIFVGGKKTQKTQKTRT